MPIRAFLRDEAFDPDQIQAMSWALEEVCNEFQVCDDRSREIVAVRIIELAQCGVHNGIVLRNRVLRESGQPPSEEAPIVPWQGPHAS